MRYPRQLAAIGLLLCSFGCGAATIKQLSKRAAFELECPAEQLEIVEIDTRTRGVSGCGRRAVYVETCERFGQYNEFGKCTWTLDSNQKN
jgi:hypothetical protein